MINTKHHLSVKILLFILFPLLLYCSLQKNSTDANIKTIADKSLNNIETIATDLEVPWGIDFLPGNTLIFTERIGNVKIIVNKDVITVGKINVQSVGESGLLGVAVDPEFNQNHFIYIYYTYKNGQIYNRVSRFELKDSIANEFVLIDSIPAAFIHDGGRIAFGPDNFFYITTGDANDPSSAQDVNNLSGKILRINKDGSIPLDNPFNNPVYAYGIRNSEGIDWSGDTLYATDHGPDRHDEINRIQTGGNYGWPQTCDKYPALFCYPDFTLAPAGIAIINNLLFISCLRGNQIKRINLNSKSEESLFTSYGRLRAIKIHEEYLYFGTSNRDGRGNPEPRDDRLFRVSLKNLKDL